jgi:hypothetical protein
MAATPNSSNTLFGRGAVMFDRFDSNGVAQGQYIHLGNCSDFAISITTDVAELTDFTQSTSAVYNSAVKKTNVNVKISGFEVSTKNMGILLLGSITTYTQAAGTVSGVERSFPASSLGREGFVLQVGTKRNLTLRDAHAIGARRSSLAPITRSSTRRPACSASCLRWSRLLIPPPITATYVHTAANGRFHRARCGAALASRPTSRVSCCSYPRTRPARRSKCKPTTSRSQPDGDIGLISEDWLKWNMKGTVNSDSAGTYGGSTTEPYFRTVTR